MVVEDFMYPIYAHFLVVQVNLEISERLKELIPKKNGAKDALKLSIKQIETLELDLPDNNLNISIG